MTALNWRRSLADELVGVIAGAELFEVVQHAGQRLVGVVDGQLREVLALSREAFPMPDELLPIEVGRDTDMNARKPDGLTVRAMRLLAWFILWGKSIVIVT